MSDSFFICVNTKIARRLRRSRACRAPARPSGRDRGGGYADREPAELQQGPGDRDREHAELRSTASRRRSRQGPRISRSWPCRTRTRSSRWTSPAGRRKPTRSIVKIQPTSDKPTARPRPARPTPRPARPRPARPPVPSKNRHTARTATRPGRPGQAGQAPTPARAAPTRRPTCQTSKRGCRHG
jgi:hypothetical protein